MVLLDQYNYEQLADKRVKKYIYICQPNILLQNFFVSTTANKRVTVTTGHTKKTYFSVVMRQ